MSRIPFRVEVVRNHAANRAQKSLDRAKATAVRESARSDLEKATANLSDKLAAVYRDEMRRLLGPESQPTIEGRLDTNKAAAEALFSTGRAA